MTGEYDKGIGLRDSLQETFLSFIKAHPDMPVGLTLAAVAEFTMTLVVSQMDADEAVEFFEESTKAVAAYAANYRESSEDRARGNR